MNKEERDEQIRRSRQQLGDSLDNLLNDDNLLDDLSDPDLTSDLAPVTPNVQHDYDRMKDSSTEKAKKTITALMKFYLSADIIEKDEYVRARKKIDEMTLSSLMFQLETAEKALVTLLRTIDSGELAPRMFEVLATLQKSMLDIIKSQTMYLVAAEESVKKLSRDIDMVAAKSNDKSKLEEPGKIDNLNRGTKDLMKSIQADIREENIEDIDSIEDDENNDENEIQ